MPLRDHFRPPVSSRHSWDGLHGGWPMMIVLSLFGRLPKGYAASPTVHVGRYVEVDVGTFGQDDTTPPSSAADEGGVAVWAPARPSVAVETEISGTDAYEVRVYDMEHDRTLVAAIEIVSPSNKDRPDSRQEFVAKCAALLRQRVSVAIVDLVTDRQFNLYADLLRVLGQSDPTLGPEPPHVYAAECRWTKKKKKPGLLETWSHTLAVGQPLPTLPLWLGEGLVVPLELEQSYEETCRVLHIT